ncbi:hypothetical protein HHK36_003647 [Tetracentron sinense]|uniref:OPA3-like protein n=1 Tax=Tetracentron sinense TaxID=13715 RepID=A0A835DP64_TETSI|nr:hypothetical protein HHK36_003647 [Tetracentron sinense]
MILPGLKLGTLALKTLCKPIASRLKKEAGKHPKFRQSIINFAQAYDLLSRYNVGWDGELEYSLITKESHANHRFQTTMQRRIYAYATDVEIHPLNEEKAVQAAADFLGEFFVFSVAGAVVIFEVQRSSRSEARKEELRKQELEAMKQRDEDLAREAELLKHKLEELEHLAKGRGLTGIFNFKHAHATEDGKSANPI